MSKSKYSHARKGSKKPLFAGIALVLVAASLIGGALAWTDFSQSRTNKFRGTYDADVTLHDEFDGENKDVFVENTGTNPIYVRVRLDEFMQIGNDNVFQMDNANGTNRPVADVRDKTTWTPHTYGQYGNLEDIGDCNHTNVEDCKFHKYYDWDMSGKQRPYTLGTPGMVYGTLDAEGKVDDYTAADGATRFDTAAEAKPILMTDFIRISAWLSAGNPVTSLSAENEKVYDAYTAGCWILDDTDTASKGGGWAYWSKPLQPAKYDTDGKTIITPGETTNLLLDEVKQLTDAEDDWIYRIDVKLQAVTLGDTEKWHNDPAYPDSPFGYRLTDGARELIAAWQ